MKTNEELQRDIQNAIKWEPLLNAAEIGVTAKDGVVTLTGTVDSYAKKLEVEDAAKSVAGVRAVAETIKVRFDHSGKKSDTEVANEILSAFKLNWEVPDERLKINVEGGWVTLEGEVEWNHQREAAKKVVKAITGVIGVTDDIRIKSESHDRIEQKSIERALSRNWSLDQEDIHVTVADNDVKLTGLVSSLYQKDEAERIAWNAPGVWGVKNELLVDWAD